ncbi:hypothetical protein B0A55_00992 [Friedmanniomyces simplex]|uniref:Ubiquitin-protein ligase sel1 n=1 Tax=Friedmanniomyces simplex TaxID=329884 RepID=A0A4U0XXW8_9PEZI|nr:hypothetical protein B0A55_00992 [Friedmanniomyces simplex]
MLTTTYRLWKRQGGSDSTFGYDGSGNGDDYYDSGDDYYGGSWWWTPAGMAVRYAVVALLFAFVLLFFVGGYYHGRRRMRKGLPPLAYHRWMVRRYMQHPQQQRGYAQYQQFPPTQGYQMENYPPPPPAYNHHEAPPPTYQPPEGGSKVMADQSYVYTQPLPQTPGHQAGEASQMHGAVRQ